MNILHTKSELVFWLRDQIASIEPKITMPSSFVVTYNDLFALFEESGKFNIGSDDLWPEYLQAVLDDIIKTQDKKIKAGARTTEFIAEVYAQAVLGDSGGYVSFARFIRLTMRVLRLKPKDLVFGKIKGRHFLISSARFERRYHVRVEVRLTGDEGFVELAKDEEREAENDDAYAL
jgi:hypothetical protein